MNGNTHFLEEWAKDSYPQLNEKKTKQMLLTCNVISSLTVKGQTLESVRTFKLLGTWLNENLKWPDHVKELVSCVIKFFQFYLKYETCMAPWQVKNQLAESLIIFKLDFNKIVCYPSPAYLQKKVQRVRNVAASFVRSRYSTEQDIVNLGWLPPLKGRNCTLSNLLTVRYTRIPGPNICLCHYTTLKGNCDQLIHYR